MKPSNTNYKCKAAVNQLGSLWFLWGTKPQTGETKLQEESLCGSKNKTRVTWMGCAADLMHSLTGANQYPPKLPVTFTFKTGLKEQKDTLRISE